MRKQPPRNYNHPKKGSSIKVEPIRRCEDIRRIKALLADRPRDLCLFTFGINTAYRAGELLSIKVGDVAHLKPGDYFDNKQSKNDRYRAITINKTVHEAIQRWLKVHPNPTNDAYLFQSSKTRSALTVSTVSRMVKGWCTTIGLGGNFGSHSMRKTWGYHQRVYHSQSLTLLMVAYGHSTERQTLEYLCIQESEIRGLFETEL